VTRDAADPMEAEFGTVAEWTAGVAADLGPDYYIPAACRGSGQPAVLDWLLDRLQPRAGDVLLDAGAGMGGPAAYAARQAGVRPVLAEPEPGACRAAARLFGAPPTEATVVRADATALPWADACVPLAWCLGVLCTASGAEAQQAILSELRRVIAPGGRIGLLVFVAVAAVLDSPPQGNHFPASGQLHAQLGRAGLEAVDVADFGDLGDPPPDWTERAGVVERELQRRYGRTRQLVVAGEQSDRIGKLLASGQLTAQVILLRPRPSPEPSLPPAPAWSARPGARPRRTGESARPPCCGRGVPAPRSRAPSRRSPTGT
jgi:SAM-dependent methyltransferase